VREGPSADAVPYWMPSADASMPLVFENTGAIGIEGSQVIGEVVDPYGGGSQDAKQLIQELGGGLAYSQRGGLPTSGGLPQQRLVIGQDCTTS